MTTSRQIRDRTLRSIGVRPIRSYAWSVGPGDVLGLATASGRRCKATVVRVLDHGWYRVVAVRTRRGAVRQLRLWRDGPPDDGVVEVRLLKRVHQQRQPEDAEAVTLAGRSGSLRWLQWPERCPECGTLCRWVPKAGWPCHACRVTRSVAKAF